MTKQGNKKQTSPLSLLVRLVVAALACWLIFKDFDFDILRRLHVSTLSLAIGFFAGGVCLIGIRWWVFMRAQKIQIPPSMAIKLTFLGQFFTNFMPSAVGGDLIRAWYVSQYSHKKLQAALGVMVDRVMGLVSTFILAMGSYFLFMRGRGIFQMEAGGAAQGPTFFEKHPVSVPHIVLAAAIIVGVILILSAVFNLKAFFGKLYAHFKHILVQFKEVMLVYYHHPLILVFGLLVTILLQSGVIISLWLVGRDLGITAELRYYFAFFPLVWVIGSIPVSIGGLGILEGGLVVLFVTFAGAQEDAVKALALCQRLTWVLASIPGMIIHLTGAHRREND